MTDAKGMNESRMIVSSRSRMVGIFLWRVTINNYLQRCITVYSVYDVYILFISSQRTDRHDRKSTDPHNFVSRTMYNIIYSRFLY
jgi:hypothetical protein